MLKVIFYLKAGKANKKGESPIFTRISYNQQSITMWSVCSETGGQFALE